VSTTSRFYIKPKGATEKPNRSIGGRWRPRAIHAREGAAALYNNLFGKLDDKLKRYDTLYIAPDGFLSLLAFPELVTPDGQYWVQRQTLRQVSTGRHLIAAYDRDLDKPKGLLALGGWTMRNSALPRTHRRNNRRYRQIKT